MKNMPASRYIENFSTEDWPLQAIKIEVWRNLVFIANDPVSSLSVQLGATIDELTDVPMEDYKLVATKELVFDATGRSIPTTLYRVTTFPVFIRSFFER